MPPVLFLYAAAILLPTSPGSRTSDPAKPPVPYEVNTHQTMGLLAARRSPNLQRFLDDFGLGQEDYSRQFPNLAQRLFPQIRVTNSSAVDLIGAGCVLEDSDYRFFRHFFDPTTRRGFQLPFRSWQASPDWAFDGGTEQNERSWVRALDYFETSVRGASPEQRRRAQELLFVTIGHVAHLVQDACQPSHTRNDGHGGYGTGHSVLEAYGATRISSPDTLPTSVRTALAQTPASYENTIRGIFATAANFSNQQFFSDDTIFRDYALPGPAETRRRVDTVGETDFTFVISNSLADPTNRTEAQRLARVNFGLFSDSFTLASPGQRVALDNFESLMPTAVSLSEAVINHFLRGRIQLSIDQQQQPARVMMKNISDVAAVGGDPSNAALSAGELRLFYESVSGAMIELPAAISPQPLSGIVAPGESVELQGDMVSFLDQVSASSLPNSTRARPDKRVVVTFRGTIGSEDAVCAGRITFSNNVSLLLSFDTSGSIGNQMPAARNAGLTLLPFLQRGRGNRISVQRFSSSASTIVPWTADTLQAEAAIRNLSPGGSTALNDAIVLAGDSAFGESQRASQAGEPQKVIVVLFTDGLENSSNAMPPAAVAAISRIGRPQVDEVFLVYVNNGSGLGATQLSNTAAQAGRRYYRLDNFDELTQVFLNIIGASNP